MAEEIGQTEGAGVDAILSMSVPKTDILDSKKEELQRRENVYVGGVVSLFGTLKEPHNWNTPFVPDFPTVGRTKEDVRGRIKNILEKGKSYYEGLKEVTSFSSPNEQQLALYDRALGYMNGERSNSDSYFTAVDQMAEMTIFLSKEELKERVNYEYNSEGGDKKLWVGKVIKGGKMQVLSSSKEQSLLEYQKKTENHAYQVAMLATDGLRVPDKLKNK